MSRLPEMGTYVCPQCHVRGVVRLRADQTCAACASTNAWTQASGGTLVIDDAAIAAAEAKRAGDKPGLGPLVLAILPALVCVAVGFATLRELVLVLHKRPVGSLGALFGSLVSTGRAATLLGVASLALSIVALIRLRRGRHHRNLALLGGVLFATVVGLGGGVVGALHWLGGGGGLNLKYLSMPRREALAVPSERVDRIMNATAILIAPGKDGDAREAALGTGAIIATKADRAYIVTCSHVAMPYADVGAFKDATKAQPLWVQLSDGRAGVGHVKWIARPPLDVAVVELAIADPPERVVISPDTEALQADAPVTFVPNPLRDGWLVYDGVVQRRELHDTPAGPFSLLFTDLPVKPGDSGSGLYDGRGQLVGLNTWTRLQEGEAPQGISLPSEAMRTIVDAIDHDQLDSVNLQ